MAAKSMVSPLSLPTTRSPRVACSFILSDYWALTKPEVNFLILVTTFAGFYLGRSVGWRDFPLSLAINAVVGTLLVSSGTGALNQYVERDFDAEMRRTARRPLAAGRLKPSEGLWFGVALSVTGTVYLALAVNVLASLLALATLLAYLFLYTPLKRKSPLCTLVGAFPGAMPPLIGWASATGRLTYEAWGLFAALFLWQFPHFMAIAWMYREDYERAGYRVLPHGEPARHRFVDIQTIMPLLGLLPMSLLHAHAGRMGTLCYAGAFFLGLWFLYYGARFVAQGSNSAARRLLTASIVYLPVLFILKVVLATG